MQLPDIFVARHGETEWNLQRKMQGNLNSALTAKGEWQARNLQPILAAHVPNAAHYYSSPQPRAIITAQIAMGDRATVLSQDPRLREIDVGDWQGQSSDTIKASLSDQSLTHMLHYYDYAPGGEGFAGLRARCLEFLGTLKAPSVIFTHGITSRMIRAIALGFSDDQLSDLPGGQGIVFHIHNGVQKILR